MYAISGDLFSNVLLGTGANYFVLGMTGAASFQVSATYSAASFVICGIALAILGRENLPICDLMGFTGGVATTATLLAMSWQPIGWMAGCIVVTHLAIAILVEATRPNEYKTA